MKTASPNNFVPLGSSPFRHDIQGLRAVAVLLVLLYHAGVAQFSGGFVGVDVFFVLSGYLITGLLIRELEETGTIRLLTFYAKRARRLLPASFAVLAAVGIVLFAVPRWLPQLIIPQLYGRSISWDIQRSGLYIVNWLFAERAVDYHNASAVPSPVQHFWSLAVEEQFYAVWPLLLLAVSGVSASLGAKRSRGVLAVVLVCITVTSFLYSYRYSTTNPAKAYFVTTTRIWELSAGGLLALLLPAMAEPIGRLRRSTSQSIAILLTTGGLGAVLASSVVFGSSTTFPGTAALLPVIGTLLVIAGGLVGRTPVLTKMLDSPAMQWTGERSYSLYLWHWPLLWFARVLFGTITVAQGLVVIAISVLPAMASYRWIEQPFRHQRMLAAPIRGIAFGGLLTVGAYLLGMVLLQTTTQTDSPFSVAEAAPQVAEVLGVQLSVGDVTPSFVDAQHDLPLGYESGCFDEFRCSLGNADAETTVVILGNSHAAQWVPALEQLAENRNWHLIVMAASGCRTALGAPAATQAFDRCETWPSDVRSQLPAMVLEDGIDLVLVSENRLLLEPTIEQERALTQSYVDSWDYLEALDVPVAVLRPTPGGKVIGVDCPSLLIGSLLDCALSVDDASRGERPILDAAHERGLPILDMFAYLCVDDVCPAVIDDLLVRRDDHHLTNTFAAALTNAFGHEIDLLVREQGWDSALTSNP